MGELASEGCFTSGWRAVMDAHSMCSIHASNPVIGVLSRSVTFKLLGEHDMLRKLV